jgi:hypothetical protein
MGEALSRDAMVNAHRLRHSTAAKRGREYSPAGDRLSAVTARAGNDGDGRLSVVNFSWSPLTYRIR